ncbi:Daunorubicin/doxorubicin resistance ATP-binding protein DrrA [Corynebacterium kalinowskii]|uniref:Daunorubicin/doxorubicin resistance ATP-binding protein DrrA n=1 Tax=Corynebacterium kalinowskii TaxID=2675216 RepID=A0A6B8VPD9_9CORY|nr:ABC transporter ATP-binding protein [Corynebacterium kalinowskii]QGU03274.1 Daunorubicin/doxorubicin resistance ATP-binding protein DrrA [Corynebacterium kalinowskii]
MNVITINNLTIQFGNFKALDGLDMSVEEGSIHGFLGPNGSGKSTTIRTLLGLLHPKSGEVRVLGEDPKTNPAVLKRVAYVPGDVTLWPNLTGFETFRALESLRGRPTDRQREKELIEAFELDPTKKAKSYSTGNRRKVLLVAALSANAELLIMDEPTAGLDPLMERVFQAQLKKDNERGASVLLSSHILSEVEALCDSVTVIKDGRVAQRGKIDTLRELAGHRVSANVDGKHILETVPETNVNAILERLLAQGATNISVTTASLEETFLKAYANDGSDQ